MRVIGTAGHIDHGKSSLVHALTGIDPDRLPEEKARGMTIELGFAALDLGDGEPVGVIDVPGHERFVRHMLAGVGGIDLALLVVAADEAVMPQTREHLAILDLLDLRHGVVALTKCDLVDDEWLELVAEEVRGALATSALASSPIVPCSSVTGAGLDALKATLRQALASLPARPDRGRPHLPVDRVFTRSGYGTVVTGTLLDGSLAVSQEVEFAPTGLRGRIRGLQSHHQRLERAGPGRRLAVNVAGVGHDQVLRGMVLCLPGGVPAAQYLDLRLRVVDEALLPQLGAAEVQHAGGVAHNMAVTLHTGAAEARGRLRLLEADTLAPGQEGWAQVRLESPIAVLRGDRCVLRIPSPALTVAGGTVVAVNPPRHRRRSRQVLRRLETLATATPEERLLDALATGPATAAELATRADLQAADAEAAMRTLTAAAAISPLAPGGTHYTTPAWLAAVTARAMPILEHYHHRFPLRQGMAGEALRDELGLARRPWGELVERWRADGTIASHGDLVRLPEHRVVLEPAQERAATTLLARLGEQPYAPPTGAELGPIEAELLEALIGRGDPVRLAEGILLRRDAYLAMRDMALSLIDTEGQVTVAMLRDRFGTSRKFALALLEHLDDLRLTRRVGDGRVRGPGAPVRLGDAARE
jgi:selenocysteine-specific elongation factor